MTSGRSASRRLAQRLAEACGSMSIIADAWTERSNATARHRATVVLPVPPFCAISAIVSI